MCDLVTGMMILGGVSTLVSTAGAIQQGQAEREAAEYNAEVMRQGAQASRDKAEYDETIHRERIRRLLSSQRAEYGASGVDMAGSPLLVLEDTAAQGELDARAIRYGGEVEARQKLSQAEIYEQQGKSAKTASYYKAGSSLLSGGASIAKTYYDAKNPVTRVRAK
jgi:hypothetical protein